MNLTIYDQFEQNTPLWNLARLGLPTTSCFKTIMARGVKDARSVTRQRYLDDLTAELKTGMPVESYQSPAMARGHDWEPDALAAYVAKTGADIKRVAFVRNDIVGAGGSPDGLIGNDGGVEVKTLAPGLMVAHECAPGIPPGHLPQIHGLMWVTDRQWWDLVIYSPGFDLYVERVFRDMTYIDEIRRYLTTFQSELEARIMQATKGEYTFKGLRKLRDQYLLERIEEEADRMPPEAMEAIEKAQHEGLVANLRASLATEGGSDAV